MKNSHITNAPINKKVKIKMKELKYFKYTKRLELNVKSHGFIINSNTEINESKIIRFLKVSFNLVNEKKIESARAIKGEINE